MPTSTYHHVPVLLKEVLDLLNPEPGKNYIDATLGGGGYSRAILAKIGESGKLLSIDLDIDAVANAREEIAKLKIANWVLHHGNFSHVDKIARHHKLEAPEGIVADIGLSSYELDQAGRGMSFQRQELLDMRFDQSEEQVDARYLLKEKTVAELTGIFREFGEERFGYQIAKRIDEYRNKRGHIQYTTELYKVIESALPKPVRHKASDSARRIFQALRIAVNHELENLQEFLPKAFDLLAPGGRLVVVSFHSLEDRMVKQFFTRLSKGCVCPLDFPECRCGRSPQGKLLTKKPVTAGQTELDKNPRSKAAKLRAIVKI